MSRASGIYIIFTAVFALGIWAILALGSATLAAPEDLAGQWAIASSDGGAAGGSAGTISASTMTIDQSGRFFELQFKNGRRVHLTLLKLQTDESSLPHRTRLTLAGGGIAATISGPAGGAEVDFALKGSALEAQLATFHARRTLRFYEPAEAKALRATTRPSQPLSTAGGSSHS